MLKDKQELTDEEQVALGLFLIGDGYMKGIYLEKDEKKAFHFFQDSAIKYNYTDAENALGFCYLNGVGVKQDEQKSASWFKKAADKDDKVGQACLGYCYYEGIGVEKNHKKALYLINEAARKGNSFAIEMLEEIEKEKDNKE